MSYHSKVSPSQAHRFFACPGSVQAQARITTPKPMNQAAMEGTAIHEFAAQCLQKRIQPESLKGTRIKIKAGNSSVSFPITDDFIYTAGLYIKVIRDTAREAGVLESSIQVETRFHLPEIDEHATGTTDCWFLAGDTLHVFDLKSGRGIIVDPTENKQCMYYALRPCMDARIFIQRVVIWIIQPRAKEGDYIKKWETTPERLMSFADELKEAITKTRMKAAPLVAGDHCKFCLAMDGDALEGIPPCAMMQNHIRKEIAPALTTPALNFKPIVKMTGEEIGNALAAMGLLAAYQKHLEAYALKLALEGKVIKNFAVGEGKKQRRYIDEESVESAFKKEFGEKIYEPRKIVTLTKMEKIVGKENLEPYLEKPTGEPKLVLESEVKKRIETNIEEIFKDINPEKFKSKEKING